MRHDITLYALKTICRVGAGQGAGTRVGFLLPVTDISKYIRALQTCVWVISEKSYETNSKRWQQYSDD